VTLMLEQEEPVLKMRMLQNEDDKEKKLKLELRLRSGSSVCMLEDETNALEEKAPSLCVDAFEVVPWLLIFWVGVGLNKMHNLWE
jgi:hypothetical protein